MKTWHRVTLNPRLDADFVKALEDMGAQYKTLPLPGFAVGLIYFDIEESDPQWPRVDELIRTHGASNMFETFFTRDEIAEAEWSRLTVVFEQGYPQPKNGWEEVTYENRCPRCAAGYRQKTPFRIAKELRMGKNDFMGLYWTWTAFCSHEVVSAVRKAGLTGYEVWTPVIHKTGEPSKVISQLLWTQVSGTAISEEDKVRPETCPVCGITKYAYHKRGYMRVKKDSLPEGSDFVQIYEWFNSGGASYREVLVSNRMARLVLEKKWRGLRLKPVELV